MDDLALRPNRGRNDPKPAVWAPVHRNDSGRTYGRRGSCANAATFA